MKEVNSDSFDEITKEGLFFCGNVEILPEIMKILMLSYFLSPENI